MMIIKTFPARQVFKILAVGLACLSSGGYAQTFPQPSQQQLQNQQQQQQENAKQALQYLNGVTNNLNNLYQQEWNKAHPNTPAPAIAPLITNPVQQILMPNANPAVTNLLPSAQPQPMQPQNNNVSTGQGNQTQNLAPNPVNKP